MEQNKEVTWLMTKLPEFLSQRHLAGRSSIDRQHYQVLLPLWFKMRTLWMVLWEEESVGTVQLRDLYQGVGSTATAASASRISRV